MALFSNLKIYLLMFMEPKPYITNINFISFFIYSFSSKIIIKTFKFK